MLVLICVIVGYMGLLVVLAMTSPGVGPIGMLMLILPGDLMEGMHAPAYGLLALLVIRAFDRRGWPVPFAVTVGLLVAVVFGLWTEVAQGPVPGREPSVKDMLVNLVGILSAGTMVLWQQGMFHTGRQGAPTSTRHRLGRGWERLTR